MLRESRRYVFRGLGFPSVIGTLETNLICSLNLALLSVLRLLSNKKCRYLIGQETISNQTSNQRKQMKATDRHITCVDCGEEFVGNYRAKRCKPCAKERVNALEREKRKANPEKYRARERARYAASPKRLEQKLANSHANIERTRANRKKSWLKNRDKNLAKKKLDRKANPEKYSEINKRKRARYHDDREKYQKEARERRLANPEKFRTQAKVRYYANQLKFLNEKKEYYKNNREEINKRAKAARKNNPEKYRSQYKKAERKRPVGQARAKSAARRARRDDAILPTTDFEKIKLFYVQRAEITKATGIEHHVDHIIQLSIGGAHHQDNLRVITATENLTRGYDFDPSLGGVWADNNLARETKRKLTKGNK